MNRADPFWAKATQNHDVIENSRYRRPTDKGNVTRDSGESGSPVVRGLQGDLPPAEDLPPSVQEFLRDIRDLDPMDKVQLIHDFVRGRMDYSYEQAYGGADNSGLDYKSTIADWQNGDCDNHATMMAAMLQYAGFDRADMTWIAANVSIKNEAGVPVMDGPHAVLILEIDGQKMLLDMNMGDVVPLDENFQATGRAAGDETPVMTDQQVRVSIDEIILAVPMDAAAKATVNNEALKRMNSDREPEQTVKVTEAAPENLPMPE